MWRHLNKNRRRNRNLLTNKNKKKKLVDKILLLENHLQRLCYKFPGFKLVQLYSWESTKCFEPEKFGGFEKPFATSFMNLFGTEKFSGDTDDERHLLGLSRQVPIGDSRATSRPLSVEREQLLDPLARGQGRSGDAEGRRWNELVFFCSPCPLGVRESIHRFLRRCRAQVRARSPTCMIYFGNRRSQRARKVSPRDRGTLE
jgi:hypothetical protein